MKKTNLFTIAMLLLLGAIFFSCSNSSAGGQVQPRPNVVLSANLSALEIAKKMECGINNFLLGHGRVNDESGCKKPIETNQNRYYVYLAAFGVARKRVSRHL